MSERMHIIVTAKFTKALYAICGSAPDATRDLSVRAARLSGNAYLEAMGICPACIRRLHQDRFATWPAWIKPAGGDVIDEKRPKRTRRNRTRSTAITDL